MATSLRHHRMLPLLVVVVVEVHHHPISHLPQLMANAVLEYSTLKCQLPRSVCNTGSHASFFGLN
ncbi:MAG: hypothetical protein V3R62_06040 [Acidiferrobacterales bacterium]